MIKVGTVGVFIAVIVIPLACCYLCCDKTTLITWIGAIFVVGNELHSILTAGEGGEGAVINFR